MSLDVSFSLWAFYLIYKFERLVGSTTGISTILYHKGFVPYREMGAYLILILFFVEKSSAKRMGKNAFQ